MRGHEHLILMRRNGWLCDGIFVNDYPCNTDWWMFTDSHPTICIDAFDAIELLDWRFCIGTTVHISGREVERTRRIMNACKEAGASKIIAMASRQVPGKSYFENIFGEFWCG